MVSDVDDSAAEQAVTKLNQQGIKAIYTHCDVSRKEQVQHLIKQTVEQLGGIDIMVANAGVQSMCSTACGMAGNLLLMTWQLSLYTDCGSATNVWLHLTCCF